MDRTGASWLRVSRQIALLDHNEWITGDNRRETLNRRTVFEGTLDKRIDLVNKSPVVTDQNQTESLIPAIYGKIILSIRCAYLN